MNKVENSSPKGKGLKVGVQVGAPRSEGLKVNANKPTSEKGAKLGILAGFAGLITLQQIVFTIYGWLYSYEILKEVLQLNTYLVVVIILWATGSKVGNKAMAIVKAIWASRLN